jgi:hypothetical protein
MNDATPNLRCAWCGTGDQTSSLSDEFGDSGKTMPNDGDACLCVMCGQWSLFDTANQRLRKPDEIEAQRLRDNTEAAGIKLRWLLYVLQKRGSKRLAEGEIVDIRNRTIERCDQAIIDGSQLAEHPLEVMEIIIGVLLSTITKAAITYGSQNLTMTGREAIARLMRTLIEGCAATGVGDDVDAHLAKLRVNLVERGLTSGWPPL